MNRKKSPPLSSRCLQTVQICDESVPKWKWKENKTIAQRSTKSGKDWKYEGINRVRNERQRIKKRRYTNTNRYEHKKDRWRAHRARIHTSKSTSFRWYPLARTSYKLNWIVNTRTYIICKCVKFYSIFLRSYLFMSVRLACFFRFDHRLCWMLVAASERNGGKAGDEFFLSTSSAGMSNNFYRLMKTTTTGNFRSRVHNSTCSYSQFLLSHNNGKVLSFHWVADVVFCTLFPSCRLFFCPFAHRFLRSFFPRCFFSSQAFSLLQSEYLLKIKQNGMKRMKILSDQIK